MSESKEFLGKTLDAAIAEACSFYDCAREKLEIDIIEDAKTGIFGIVGARKARIRASLASLPDFMQKPRPEEKPERPARNERRREKNQEAPVAAPEFVKAEKENLTAPLLPEEAESSVAIADRNVPSAEEKAEQPEKKEKNTGEKQEENTSRGRRGRQPRQPRKAPRTEAPKETPKEEDGDALETALPRVALADLDQDKLLEQTRLVISRLVAPVLDVEPEDVGLSLEISDDRVQVSVKSEDTGLLIGRDGQNLAAVQYLASRMVTRAMEAQVRVQVDAGNYHMRQDSRLQELALNLAEKVKATGKVQTTRPLSAYQRRVIHLTLQDDPEVQTRSSGEGALKHVVILRRKD